MLGFLVELTPDVVKLATAVAVFPMGFFAVSEVYLEVVVAATVLRSVVVTIPAGTVVEGLVATTVSLLSRAVGFEIVDVRANKGIVVVLILLVVTTVESMPAFVPVMVVVDAREVNILVVVLVAVMEFTTELKLELVSVLFEVDAGKDTNNDIVVLVNAVADEERASDIVVVVSVIIDVAVTVFNIFDDEIVDVAIV